MKRSRSKRLVRRERNNNVDGLDDSLFYDCMYGPVNTVEESEEFVARKVREVEREIDKLSDRLKEPYFIALQEEIKQEINYVRSTKFILSFLRADAFDPAKAALRLVKFLQYKLDLFGREKLPRYIELDDLDNDDMQLLLRGTIHIDEVDCGGRLVCFFPLNRMRSLGFICEKYSKSICRVAFHMLMFAMEHNKSWDQTKGIVLVRYGLNSTLPLKDYRVFFATVVKMFTTAMPVPFAAVHIFQNNPVERACFQWTFMIVPKQVLNRVKLHSITSAAACHSVLSNYGIDVDALPLAISGEYRMHVYQNILLHMRQTELSKIVNNDVSITHIDDEMFTSPIDAVACIHDEMRTAPIDNVPCIQNIGVDDFELVAIDPNSILNSGIEIKSPVSSNAKKNPSKPAVEDHFPLQLMEVLQNNMNPDAIWWSRGGTAFFIERKKFSEEVLRKEFSGIKYDSFNRRLRRWKFRRLSNKIVGGSHYIEFQHRLFQRDSPQLLEDWDITEEDNLGRKDKFPVKLRKLLDSNEALDSIWWVLNGTAFAIEMNRFSCSVLKTDFEGIKASSFIRMLRKWGFRRLPDSEGKDASTNVMVFQHSLFQKDSILPDAPLETWSDSAPGGTTKNLCSKDKGESFQKKLYRILGKNNAPNALWWLECGTAFALRTSDFKRDVLPVEYSGIKWSSFQRNLQRWGFKRYQNNAYIPNASIYTHPSFIRNSPELLDKWENKES